MCLSLGLRVWTSEEHTRLSPTLLLFCLYDIIHCYQQATEMVSFFTEVSLFYKVMSVPAVWIEPPVCIHISPPSWTNPHPWTLLRPQGTELSSLLLVTAGSHWLFCTWQRPHVDSHLPVHRPPCGRCPFSTSALQIGSTAWLSRFHIYGLIDNICFSLSGLYHSVWKTLGQLTSPLMSQYFFLWLSNIPPGYVHSIFNLKTHSIQTHLIQKLLRWYTKWNNHIYI